jgi:hypothetical protein
MLRITYLCSRVTRPVQGHIMWRLCLPRHAHTADLAEATRAHSVVALHLHRHRDRWDVPKDEEKVGTELNCAPHRRIPRVHTELEPEQFSHERPEKRVEILRLLRTGDDTDTHHVLQPEADLGG